MAALKEPRMPTTMGQKLSYGDAGPHFMVTKGGDADLTYEDSDTTAFQLGKRYVSPATGITVLCTKPGLGRLLARGEQLEMLAAKKLPSSD